MKLKFFDSSYHHNRCNVCSRYLDNPYYLLQKMGKGNRKECKVCLLCFEQYIDISTAIAKKGMYCKLCSNDLEIMRDATESYFAMRYVVDKNSLTVALYHPECFKLCCSFEE